MQHEIYLAGGCFWGLEQYMGLVAGVVSTEVGYANSMRANPTYEQVCSGDTGAAETVRVGYDPAVSPLDFLLQLYFDAIDPFSLNRQGGDTGTQYRTGIYYTDPADLPTIEAALRTVADKAGKPPVVEVQPLQNFYPAEEYHQKYLEKNPGGYCHIGAQAMQCAAAARPAPRWQSPPQEQLRAKLTPLQYDVTQNAATEPPFQNPYNSEFRRGIYVDITTGQPLFASSDKFESGCGWPSFSRPIAPELLDEHEDRSHGMRRVEVRSAGSAAHLGHVFPDGPKENGGLRYCINSASLRFIPAGDMAAEGYAEWLPLVNDETGK